MSSVAMLGVGGVALMAIWATTPDYRQNQDQTNPGHLDHLSVSQHVLKSSVTGERSAPPPPPHMDGSLSMTGHVPSWTASLGNPSGDRWWNNDEGTAALDYLKYSSDRRTREARKRWIPNSNPHRDQPCFDAYTTDFSKRGRLGSSVVNPF